MLYIKINKIYFDYDRASRVESKKRVQGGRAYFPWLAELFQWAFFHGPIVLDKLIGGIFPSKLSIGLDL